MSKLRKLLERAERVPGLADALAEQLAPIVRSAERADEGYERFHWGRDASRAALVEAATLRPGEAIYELGELSVVAYDTVKDDEIARWVHDFDQPYPLLCHAPRTGNLHILGGSYEVTARGIVG